VNYGGGRGELKTIIYAIHYTTIHESVQYYRLSVIGLIFSIVAYHYKLV